MNNPPPPQATDVTDLVGTVARALFAVEQSWHAYTWDGLPQVAKDLFTRNARAAIEALRSTQDAEVERLRGALEPFADAAANLDDEHRDGSNIWESSAAVSLTAGDLRRARQALAPNPTGEKA